MMYMVFLSAFLICLVITPLVRYSAIRNSWMAIPVKERWHKKPTALMGGIAIYAGMAIPLFFITDFGDVLQAFGYVEDIRVRPSINSVTFIGAAMMFLLGLSDDFLKLKPSTKLVGQILAASMVVFMGYRLQWFSSLTLDTLITMVWIVGITNAFNLIDNMDGLCAGVGAVSSVYFVFLFSDKSPEAMGIALTLAGSLSAFLLFNFNPASIFMGDSGSLVIGFILSVTAVHYAQNPVSSSLCAWSRYTP